MRISDWSSDVCSSDLVALAARQVEHLAEVDFQEILRDGKRAPEIEPPMPAVGEESPAQAAVGDVVDAAEIARSEEHTSELQSLMRISYAVFCLTKKTTHSNN